MCRTYACVHEGYDSELALTVQPAQATRLKNPTYSWERKLRRSFSAYSSFLRSAFRLLYYVLGLIFIVGLVVATSVSNCWRQIFINQKSAVLPLSRLLDLAVLPEWHIELAHSMNTTKVGTRLEIAWEVRKNGEDQKTEASPTSLAGSIISAHFWLTEQQQQQLDEMNMNSRRVI